MKNDLTLVTGAGGYIGAMLVTHLLKAGHSVVGVDRYFFGKELLGKEILEHPKFTLLKKDIRALTPFDFKGVHAVLDLAGLSNDPACDLDGALTENINLIGGFNVAQCAREAGVERYIYCSSCSVYGFGGDDKLTEKSPCHPISAYAKSKWGLEQKLLEINDPKMIVTVLRNATVFGASKRMRFDLVINLMTLYAWRDKKVYIMGGGNQWRPIVHVSDVIHAMDAVLRAPTQGVAQEIFNVGFDEFNYRVKQIASIVKRVLPEIEIIQLAEDDDRRSYCISFEKLKAQFGLKPTQTPLDGVVEIRQMLDDGAVNPADIKTVTIKYYMHLLEAEKIMSEHAINGKIF